MNLPQVYLHVFPILNPPPSSLPIPSPKEINNLSRCQCYIAVVEYKRLYVKPLSCSVESDFL